MLRRELYHTAKAVEVRIEQKLFLISLGKRGDSICVTERTRNASYLLEIGRENAYWLRKIMGDYITNPKSHTTFNRIRRGEVVISVQKFVNERGSYIEVSKIERSGKKQRIIIPSGWYEKGWKCLVFFVGKILDSGIWKGAHHLKGNQQPRQSVFRGKINPSPKGSGNIDAHKEFRQCLSKEWNNALMVTKECVNISWEMVTLALGKAVDKKIEIFPFKANQALWWPNSREDFEFYLKIGRCFLEKSISLTFQRGRSDINTTEEVYECCNSWIRIVGLPWDMWTTEVLKSVGDTCGGLVDISQDTLLLKDLAAAKIKVVGLEGGFINSSLLIQSPRGPLNVRIYVDSVNISAYDVYEKRSYAQVVVDGARVLAGWSRVKRPIEEENGHCNQLAEEKAVQATTEYKHITRDGEKAQQKINGKEESLGGEVDLNHQEWKYSNTKIIQGMEVFLGKEQQGFYKSSKEGRKGSRGLGSAPVRGSKQIKILKRISPKEVDAFNKGIIHSMTNKEDEHTGRANRPEDIRIQDKNFEVVYTRRKVKTNNAWFNTQDEATTKIKKRWLDQDSLREEQDDTWEDKDFPRDQSSGSEEDSDFNDMGTHMSISSDTTTHTGLGLEDIGNLFASPSAKVHNKTISSHFQSSDTSIHPSVFSFNKNSGVGRHIEVERGLVVGERSGMSGIRIHEGDRESGGMMTLSENDGEIGCLEIMGVKRMEIGDDLKKDGICETGGNVFR